MSSTLALCVNQPTAIWSTPVAATAGAVSGVMRPEASVVALPWHMTTAVRKVSDDLFGGAGLAMLLVVMMAFITVIHQWMLRRSYLNARS